MTSITTLVLDSLGIVALVGGGLTVLFSGRNKENNSASTELIDKLEKLRSADREEFSKQQKADRDEFSARIKVLEVQHVEDAKKQASLQGQIDILKNIPLGNIDATLVEIRDTLKSSAIVLALDTKDAALAAKEVKSTLSKDNTAVADAATIVKLTLNKATADAALAAALVKTTLAGKTK